MHWYNFDVPETYWLRPLIDEYCILPRLEDMTPQRRRQRFNNFIAELLGCWGLDRVQANVLGVGEIDVAFAIDARCSRFKPSGSKIRSPSTRSPSSRGASASAWLELAVSPYRCPATPGSPPTCWPSSSGSRGPAPQLGRGERALAEGVPSPSRASISSASSSLAGAPSSALVVMTEAADGGPWMDGHTRTPGAGSAAGNLACSGRKVIAAGAMNSASFGRLRCGGANRRTGSEDGEHGQTGDCLGRAEAPTPM
jgi:hypothetical protein